jgi:hypothetical protein
MSTKAEIMIRSWQLPLDYEHEYRFTEHEHEVANPNA